MDKKSGTKFVLAIALLGILKLTYTIVKQFVKITARVIVYFGLYIPFFYLMIGSILVGMGFFRFEVIDVNSIMFYVGMSLCLACSVLITVRTYSTKKISSVTDGVREEIIAAQRERRRRMAPPEQVKEDPILFVYHSVDHPELLIEEHEDKYVVYYDDGVNPIQQLRIEPKTR